MSRKRRQVSSACEWLGAALPANPIDGHDIRPLILGERGAKSPWDAKGFAYYNKEQLQAVRAGPWKLYLGLEKKHLNHSGKTTASQQQLFDVCHDVHEDREASAKNPEVVRRLRALVEEIRMEIGDGERPGRGQRPAGRVENPKPLLQFNLP